MIVETLLPDMIAAAKSIAAAHRKEEIARGMQRMNLTLNHEIERLYLLQQKNKNIRPEEIQIALDEQVTLVKLIQNAQIRMDAIQLILCQ